MSAMPDALSRFSYLLLTVYRRAQELPVQQFQDAVLEDLKAFVGFDSCMWGTATFRDSGIDVHSIHLHNAPPAMLEAYEQFKHEDPLTRRLAAQPRATLAFNADDVIAESGSVGLRRWSEEFGQRNGIITSDIHPVTRFVHWISLYRRDAAARYADDDVDLIARAAPHIMQALAINRLLQFDRGVSDLARSQWSVAIADGRGVVYHADAAFKELLRAEWPPTGHDDQLPDGLWSALRAGRDRVVGHEVVIHRSLEHGVLFLRGRRRHPIDSLTDSELAVARLLAQGMTHKEAARHLARSPDTVRGHVKAIFTKLAINNAVLLNPLVSLRD